MPTSAKIALSISVIATLGSVAWIGVREALVANESELCLHATLIVSGLVEEYVNENEGEWPTSWDDLENTTPDELRGGIFRWPEDADRIREYVTVDFDADPEQLAGLAPEEFSAIAPIGPCFSSHSRGFPFIIEALKQHHPVAYDASQQSAAAESGVQPNRLDL